MNTKFILIATIVMVAILSIIGVGYFLSKNSVKSHASTGTQGAGTHPVTLSGTLELLHGDNFKNKTSIETYLLKQTDGTIVNVHFENNKTDIPPNSSVTIQGLQEDSFVTVQSIQLLQLPKITRPGSQSNRKLAFILFNFQNDQSRPFTTAQILNIISNNPDSMKVYYHEASFNELTLQPNVFDWVTLSDQNTNCNQNFQGWSQHARTILQNNGIDLSQYDNFIYIMPYTLGCPSGSWAFLEGNESWIVTLNPPNTNYIEDSAIHEFGHNLGLEHADGYTCYDSPAHTHSVVISAYCTSQDYGDPFDPMGQPTPPHHMNSYHKGQLGWFNPANEQTAPFPSISTPITYTIYPQEIPITNQTQSLRIFRDYEGGQPIYYYIEYRQPYGIFDNFSPTHPVVKGINIRLAPDYLTNSHALDFHTNLINNHPNDITFTNSSLQLNETFSDPLTHIQIQTVAVNSSLTQIHVWSDCVSPFTDIVGNTFYPAIHYLTCRGMIDGTDSTHFSPASSATRGQFAKAVVLGFSVLTYTPPGGGHTFTDVPTTYPHFQYIESAYHAGVVSGFDQATCTAHQATYPCFLPDLAITRGQLTKLVVNAAQYPLYTPPSGGHTFSDVLPGDVFFDSIETAHHKGVINGYTNGAFGPNSSIRRDEMAQIIYAGITTPSGR